MTKKKKKSNYSDLKCDNHEPPTYQEATAGYGEMEAQFTWDDKIIPAGYRGDHLSLYILVTNTVADLIHGNSVSCSEPVRFYIQTHPGLYMASYLMFFATYIALSCCGDLRRQFPYNVILLVLFTISMAFMMGFVSSFYNTKSVMLCLGITALVCLSITTFSFQSKVDVTSCQGVLFSLCMVMLLCAITLSIVVPFGYVSSHLRVQILLEESKYRASQE
uniref:Protein lifeguard 2 n=1 Tax=Gouania willdenowi TaxID=441366 RepID=A0A8C5HK81_GOUWI